MVICPIARMVHCTGCILVKICPAKTILGDFDKFNAENKENVDEKQDSEKSAKQET